MSAKLAEDQPVIGPQKSVPLKLNEPQIDSSDPWRDDLLSRQDIAARLTDLVATQEPPLTISIHGQWGTGKTFLLKRWQRALETAGYQAIYFNAWEDDFNDDPLLAILGQLSDYFSKGFFQETVGKVTKSALPLFKSNASSLFNRYTGLTSEFEHKLPTKDDLLKDYLEQRRTKDQLRADLENLSAQVQSKSAHPLVFIIDELDRCRPTFAIELLERVKHIFDIPNMVFVFGLNRDELCKSLKSIYGDIKSDIYLRRFFDMEFNLPPANAEAFAQNLMRQHEMDDFFAELSTSVNNNVHIEEFRTLMGRFPTLWNYLDLSLRDIQNCVTLFALVSRNLKPGQYMYPWVLGLLITLKLKNLALYREFVQGSCQANAVIDFFDGLLPIESTDRSLAHLMQLAEVDLYAAESGGSYRDFPTDTPLGQLKLIRDGKSLTNKAHLSQRTQHCTSEYADYMLKIIESDMHFFWHRISKAHIINLIELHDGLVRR